MPIVIDRTSGEVFATSELTPEQKQQAWEAVLRNYLKKHPDLFENGIKEKEL